jgi:2-polyprenyl-3-methyl-5-hydroxy-6-metoxy-1,4-benzoquinol methylase
MSDHEQRGGVARTVSAGIGRWRERARQGVGVMCYHLLRRARARSGLARWLDVQVHEIVTAPPWRLRLPPRPARGLAVEELASGHGSHLERLRAPVGAPYAQRFEAGHRCIGAWLDGRLVAFVWLRPGPARLPSMLGCTWQLPAAGAWVYDIYSDPHVLGAVPHLYVYLRQHRLSEAVRVLIGETELDNYRSRRAHRSLGYEVAALHWSVRIGKLRFHLSRGLMGRGWHVHRGDALLPLHALTAEFEGTGEAPRDGSVRLQCACGRPVDANEERFTCECGRVLGTRRHGMMALRARRLRPGELSAETMERLLAQTQARGWRAAAKENLPETMLEYVGSPHRAAFHDLLPLAPGARVLEVGANWGGVAAALAGHYRVVALEDVDERARFLALRKAEDGLDLDIIHGDLDAPAVAAGQFDAVIATGVLDWVGGEPGRSPRQSQVALLCRWREWLARGGVIYVATENRFGQERRRRAAWHRGVGEKQAMVRARKRTYSYRGYRRLFADAGLRIAAAWISPGGYDCPDRLVPIHRAAIRYAHSAGAATPPSWARTAGERAWLWRWLGSDFVFLLAPAADARERAAWTTAKRAAGSHYA